MPRIRVLYAWEGNDRPWPPLAVVDVDDEIVRDRVPAGHAEVVDDDTPLTAELVPAVDEPEPPEEDDDDEGAALSGDSSDDSDSDNGDGDLDLTVLKGRVPAVTAAVQEITSADALAKLRAAEAAQRRPRPGVLSAIDERVAALASEGDGDDGDDD